MQESRKEAFCTWNSMILNLELWKSLIESQYARIPELIKSQFAYWWMFCNRSSNNRINHLHEWALQLFCNNHSSTFEDLLLKDNPVSIHHKNISLLAAELYKAKNNLSTELMLEVNYNICSQTFLRSVNTSSYGLKSLRYLASKIWNLIPQDAQSANSFTQFIWKIKSLTPDGCCCVLCRTYIGQGGYMN